MTKLIGQSQVSNLVIKNPQRFLSTLKTLAEIFSTVLSEEVKKMWLECFQANSIEAWGEAVKYCRDNFDHFPLPIEMQRVAEGIENKKIKSLISPEQTASIPKAFLPGQAEDYSEEYRQANLEFIGLLASGIGQCVNFSDGRSKDKEKRRERWQETESKVAALQDKYQHLPSNYSCTHCWDSGWAHRPEGDYEMSYPCKCESGFARQKEGILSALSEKARHAKQPLPKYLHDLGPGMFPFKVKAYPCFAVFDSVGKWDFGCQANCRPQRVKWCFLQINVIVDTL